MSSVQGVNEAQARLTATPAAAVDSWWSRASGACYLPGGRYQTTVMDSALKLIDFGMSRRFTKGTPMTTRVVTPYLPCFSQSCKRCKDGGQGLQRLSCNMRRARKNSLPRARSVRAPSATAAHRPAFPSRRDSAWTQSGIIDNSQA